MIEKLYSDVQNLKKKNSKAWPYVYKVNKLLVNIFFPIIQSFNHSIGVDDKNNIIVSLTTYPARINTVGVTIESLLNQSYKPKKVLLYLSKEQFPEELNELPKKLVKLQKRGLEIVFVEDDLKPHKKYYYALQEYPNDLIITADDDIFYPEGHIERLVSTSKMFPNAVICNRSHRITMTNDLHGFEPYNSWKEILTDAPDELTVPIGCNGVLYKREFFDEELFDIEKIKKNSLYTDDLWLKVMELNNGIKAYNCVEEPLVYFDNIFNKNTGLWHTNASEQNNRNDEVWNELVKEYRLFEKLSNK
ncbi:glycosyltransferase [Pseudobutyrivibrio xylanivorans]|uniref:Glycosyl transferase family 2 n=1 Tax=Pseudobutyrivibrio xylanivorans DSM 14809 TaxID=1123012 RepID=A0A1M6GUW1_PSEXY|nr:glycosyltransferase [Pseudobutyrivibrio xylanivorans]SHJ13766.1 Glycosyl transferase family 2 [Pseudobutyrivibrio xylanivorans DSM 14809]